MTKSNLTEEFGNLDPALQNELMRMALLMKERENRKAQAQKETNRASSVKTILDNINRLLREDALYSELKNLKVGTVEERKQLKAALERVAVRFRDEAQRLGEEKPTQDDPTAQALKIAQNVKLPTAHRGSN